MPGQQNDCPRCGNAFICKSDDITNCQCYAVPLNEDTRQFLAKTHYDCLCKNCLGEIQNEIILAKGYQFPGNDIPLIENLHYYLEGTSWVFTPLYHILRGNCCRNGCRHCPYGYQK